MSKSSYAFCSCQKCFETIIVNDIDKHLSGEEKTYCEDCQIAECPDAEECQSDSSYEVGVDYALAKGD